MLTQSLLKSNLNIKLLLFYFLSMLSLIIFTDYAAAQETPSPVMTRFIVFRDANSLTVYVPDATEYRPVNMRGIFFQVVLNGPTNERVSYSLEWNYSNFWGMPFEGLQFPVCFRLLRQSASTSVLPLECQGRNVLLLAQELNNTDIFWYDSRLNQPRLILVYRGVNDAICPDSEPRCVVALPEPPPLLTPSTTLVPDTEVYSPTPETSPEIIFTPSPTLTPELLFTTPVSTTPTAKRMYATANAIIRECPAVGCGRIGSISAGEAVETIGAREGETAYGRSLWYIVEHERKTAYIHSSVLSDQAQTPQPPPPPPANPDATRPPSTGVCQRSGISGNAAGLFDYDGRRRAAVQGNQGATITVDVVVSNGQGDWGVRVSLMDGNNNELNYREIWDEVGTPTTSFSHQLPYTGTYYIEVRGDSQHIYSYRVNWGC